MLAFISSLFCDIYLSVAFTGNCIACALCQQLPTNPPQALLGYVCFVMGHHEDIPGLMQIQTYKSTSCSSRQISLLLHLNVQLCLGGFIHAAAAPNVHCYFFATKTQVGSLQTIHCIFGSELGWLCRHSWVHLHTDAIRSHLFQNPFTVVVGSV